MFSSLYARVTSRTRNPDITALGDSTCAPPAARVETLERRTLFAATVGGGLELPVMTPGQDTGGDFVALQTRAPGGNGIVNSARQIIPLVITQVVRQADQLVAQGLMGDTPFNAPLTVTARPNPNDPECPILNLELGPIHLDLLGLIVDTSEICLDIVADPDGGILGDLLCGIANLLNNNVPLGQILNNLTGDALSQLLGGIGGLLDGLFDRLTAANALSGVSGTGGPSQGGDFDTTCDILNLSVGPLDLNLLGLEVHLDDCDDGPVTLDITAEEGPGNLLGNLLCDLAGLLDSGSYQGRINSLLNRISREIENLVT